MCALWLSIRGKFQSIRAISAGLKDWEKKMDGDISAVVFSWRKRG